MASLRIIESSCVLVLFVFTAVVEQRNNYIYHHCYQEGGYCSLKNITCNNNTVIDIIWSRVGYSENWQWDGSRTNCSVTDKTCYKEIDEPKRNCSGLTVCSLDTCSTSTHQSFTCIEATNYMIINYTCIEAITNGAPSTPSRANTTGTSPANQSNLTMMSTSPSSATGSRSGQTTVVVIAVTVSMTLIIVIVVLVVIRKRRLLKDKESNRTIQSDIDQTDLVIIENENYVSKDDIRPVKAALTESISYVGTYIIDNEAYASVDQPKANKRN